MAGLPLNVKLYVLAVLACHELLLDTRAAKTFFDLNFSESC